MHAILLFMTAQCLAAGDCMHVPLMPGVEVHVTVSPRSHGRSKHNGGMSGRPSESSRKLAGPPQLEQQSPQLEQQLRRAGSSDGECSK